MNYAADDYVVYGTAGVCQIAGIETKSFDGVHEDKYCKLVPVQATGSTYYVPENTLDSKVRKLLSKDEIYTIIDNMPNIEPKWCNDRNERKQIFNAVLKSDDYEKIICMIKSLHAQKEKRISGGKRLSSNDEKTMKLAENLMYQEFAMVLGIDKDDVLQFIIDRLENTNS